MWNHSQGKIFAKKISQNYQRNMNLIKITAHGGLKYVNLIYIHASAMK